MSFDLFISYSRRDNTSGRITELKQRIEADCRAFIDAASTWSYLVTKDVWLDWLIEKRILQLRRLTVRVTECFS